MTTPVTGLPALAIPEPAPGTDVPPDLFAALLAGTVVTPTVVPLSGTPEPPADATVGETVTPAAWTAATTTLPLATPVEAAPGEVAAAPTVAPTPAAPTKADHPVRPEHPEHPVHPLHPEHPVNPVHPLHPVQAADRPEAIGAPVDPTPAPVADVPQPVAPTAVDPAAPVVAPTAAVADQAVVPVQVEARPQETSPTDPVRPAVAAAARRLHRDGDVQSLVVRLDPPELGAVLVRMTVRDGHVEVSLRAPDVAARGDLMAQAPEIAQVVRDAGLDLSSFDVTLSDAWTGADRQQQESTDRGTPRRPHRADGSATVTDDALDPAAPQPAGTWL